MKSLIKPFFTALHYNNDEYVLILLGYFKPEFYISPIFNRERRKIIIYENKPVYENLMKYTDPTADDFRGAIKYSTVEMSDYIREKILERGLSDPLKIQSIIDEAYYVGISDDDHEVIEYLADKKLPLNFNNPDIVAIVNEQSYETKKYLRDLNLIQ